jgi:hypothetical protein
MVPPASSRERKEKDIEIDRLSSLSLSARLQLILIFVLLVLGMATREQLFVVLVPSVLLGLSVSSFPSCLDPVRGESEAHSFFIL